MDFRQDSGFGIRDSGGRNPCCPNPESPILNPATQGFTLLEISLVLLIIALVAGGIVAAQVLIRTSKLQSVIREYDGYVKSVQEFQDKYKALPGDMSNAQSYWGVAASCGVGVYSGETIPVTTATCNGNADGHIGSSNDQTVLTSTQEWFYAWQHLSNAGLIDGRYTGLPISASVASEIGFNVPASQFPGAGWQLGYMIHTTNNALLWDDTYNHVFILGAYKTDFQLDDPVMSTNEAYQLDNKMDDGIAGTGKVRAWRSGTQANCSTDDGNNQATQAYTITYTKAKACSLLFIPGF